MQTLLVTIIGFEESFDLQVPAEIPVGKLIPMLCEVCAFNNAPHTERGRDRLTLSLAYSNATLPALASLLDAGVVDGSVLSLQDASSPILSRKPLESQQALQPVNIEPTEHTGNIGVRWNIR